MSDQLNLQVGDRITRGATSPGTGSVPFGYEGTIDHIEFRNGLVALISITWDQGHKDLKFMARRWDSNWLENGALIHGAAYVDEWADEFEFEV